LGFQRTELKVKNREGGVYSGQSNQGIAAVTKDLVPLSTTKLRREREKSRFPEGRKRAFLRSR